MIRIETPRLVLRRWSEEDVLPFARINADPEVMRWIGDGSLRDEEQTRRLVEVIESLWAAEGYGMFALELRETGEFAGFTGLSVPHFLPEVMPAVEIGWRLARPLWGQGLATEAARAALRFAISDRGLDRIVSICAADNGASENVMVKLGMRLDRETVHPGAGLPTRVYAISKAEYQAQR
jgi:RimJ/RimL family protein N-acetyltransferase